MGNSELFIPDKERYTDDEAMAALLRLSEHATPLPLIFKELYPGRRLVVYSSKAAADKFASTVSSFEFYNRDIVFCSDTGFLFNKEQCYKTFIPIDSVDFKKTDVFFAFDSNVTKAIFDLVKSKAEGIMAEAFRKPYVNSLLYYARQVRPLKHFLEANPKVHVIVTDTFLAPTGDLTEWERYLLENNFTREKAVEVLKSGEFPYPDGLYSEKYTKDDIIAMQSIPARRYDDKGVFRLCDMESKFVNVKDGRRVTVGQPANPDRRIYIYGGCGFFGVGSADEESFPSLLQKMLNDCGEKIGVENCSNFIWGRHDAMWYSINDNKYEDNDIIVIPFNPKWAEHFYRTTPNVHYVDITVHDKTGKEVFSDAWHPSAYGMKIYAENLFEFLQQNNFFAEPKCANEDFIKTQYPKQYGIPPFAIKGASDNLLADDYMQDLNEYLNTIRTLKRKNGAIVMNCNPFTLGHRYLIEYASKQVDHLYIFAVEEDKSFFPFNDRIKLIREGTRDLKNVDVLPSGKFIISSLTFTDYFGKKDLQDKTIDPSFDVMLFGKYIAPALNISVRFAGEEPLDKVTLQYNDAMRKILPQYGVSFTVIPRKESGGAVISASRVRKLLEEKNFREIKKIVPPTTYKYLKEKFGK